MTFRCISDHLVRASVLLSIIAAVGLGACASPPESSSQTPSQTPTASVANPAPATVRVATAGALGQAGQYLAQANGYFADEGLSDEFVNMDPDASLAGLISGEVDVAANGLDPALFNALRDGVGVRIVATQASSDLNADGVFLVVRKELIDRGEVKSFTNLKGLKAALPGRGGSLEFLLARTLEAGNLTLSDLGVIVVMNFQNAVAALGTGAVDFAFLPEPLATVAVHNGSGVKWKGAADIVPGLQQSVIVFSQRFVSEPELATKWMTAYIRGIRDYDDAFRKGLHRPQTVAALSTALGIQPALFDDMGFMQMDPDGRINMASLRDLTDWYLAVGSLNQPVDFANAVDSSFVDSALQQLGEYP